MIEAIFIPAFVGASWFIYETTHPNAHSVYCSESKVVEEVIDYKTDPIVVKGGKVIVNVNKDKNAADLIFVPEEK